MSIQEIKQRMVAAQARMQEAQDDAEAFAKAQREFQIAKADMELATSERSNPKVVVSTAEQFREAVKAIRQSGRQSEVVLSREAASVTFGGDGDNDAIANLTVKELLDALEVDTVYGKLGLQIAAGVNGDITWPALDSNIEVTVAGKGVAVGDKAVNFSTVVAAPQRVATACTVDNADIDSAAFDLRGTVLSSITKGLAQFINTVAVEDGTSNTTALAGPFVKAKGKSYTTTFAGEYPTYAELLAMQGTIAGKGVKMSGFCYLMNTATAAYLAATPKFENGNSPILEGGLANGTIAGFPVYITNAANIGNGQVNAGCFGYAALNQHGETRLIVDPYTLASSNQTKFTYNAKWSLTTLRPEAFLVGQPTK